MKKIQDTLKFWTAGLHKFKCKFKLGINVSGIRQHYITEVLGNPIDTVLP